MRLLQKKDTGTYTGFRVAGFAARDVGAYAKSMANCNCDCETTCNSYCVWPESGGHDHCFYQVTNNARNGTYSGTTT